jgi:pyruvate,water dikinase
MTIDLNSSDYVLALSDPRTTLEIVGGKGASLARLMTAGLPVPDGFHVTTAAYRLFVAENDLRPGIEKALEQVDLAQPATLESASQAIAALFAAAQTPPDVASAIALAYASLANDVVRPVAGEQAGGSLQQLTLPDTGEQADGSLKQLTPPVAVEQVGGSLKQLALPVAGEQAGGSLKQLALPVAVRSSATAEDLPEASFAGQQETFLNVAGYGDLLQAVKRCWASLWTARAIGYRNRQEIDPDRLSLAVVVQKMVPAEAAGILFTANPISGERDQTVISASWGLGESIVGGMVTPDTLTVDKASGAVLDYQIANKTAMTVCCFDEGGAKNGTDEQPVPDSLRGARVLDDVAAAELNRLGVEIEELYGMPMDIEWAQAGGRIAIVQARPITALPKEPEAPEKGPRPPTEWPMPDPRGPYMRGSIADFMPDPLTPLFATMGVPAINAGMQQTLEEQMGGRATFLANYLTTINDYAYLYMSLGCGGWGWVLFRMVPSIPRLLRNGERHWREVARPRYAETVDQWRSRLLEEMTAAELLAGASELTDAMGCYLTSLQVDAIGTAAGSEGLFTAVYDKMVKQEGDPRAATLLLGADSSPIRAEKSLYDLAQWCRERGEVARLILEMPSDRLAQQLTHGKVPLGNGNWGEFERRFRTHLRQYGHSIYDLDFAKPLPADDPLPLVEALKLFIRGEGTDPHERQRKAMERREEAISVASSRVRGLKRRLFRWVLGWAQRFALVREDSIFDIGLGYPSLRALLLELGRRLAELGALAVSDDIFWLERTEVEQATATLDARGMLEDMTGLVAERRAAWRACKRATPPQQLPPKGRVMGIKTDAFMPVDGDEQMSDLLKGVAASPGQVTATARVLLGPEDFGQMTPGDVLVAEITTPAWTPLFALAAGIVTDIGGPLSHGSIVAREYGIPAVLGTGVATRRIHSGQSVTVDGSAGTVSLT